MGRALAADPPHITDRVGDDVLPAPTKAHQHTADHQQAQGRRLGFLNSLAERHNMHSCGVKLSTPWASYFFKALVGFTNFDILFRNPFLQIFRAFLG